MPRSDHRRHSRQGLGMVLSHVLHSTERTDTRFWPITWLLIRIAWLLIVVHLFEIVRLGIVFLVGGMSARR